jgi:hypothetical protein
LMSSNISSIFSRRLSELEGSTGARSGGGGGAGGAGGGGGGAGADGAISDSDQTASCAALSIRSATKSGKLRFTSVTFPIWRGFFEPHGPGFECVGHESGMPCPAELPERNYPPMSMIVKSDLTISMYLDHTQRYLHNDNSLWLKSFE